MPEMNRWKKALTEPNAVGWIAFLILVVGIGVGAMFFDGGPVRGEAQVSFQQR